jgi:hypothetical protein
LQAGKCSGLIISNPITVNILNYGKYDINSPMYFIKKQIPDLYNKLQGSNAENLGKDFGLHRVGDTLGGIAGPAVAILLIPLIGYREIMCILSYPGFLRLQFM